MYRYWRHSLLLDIGCLWASSTGYAEVEGQGRSIGAEGRGSKSQFNFIPNRIEVCLQCEILPTKEAKHFFLRIAPFPPHWVINIVCPHLNIGIWQFWISTFSGVMGVTVIHTTIGGKPAVCMLDGSGLWLNCCRLPYIGGLDQMTSAKDFKLISWRNFLGLFAIVVAVLIPVGLRYYWRDELDSVAQAEREAGERQLALEGIIVESGPTPVDKGKAISQLVLLDDSDSDLQVGDEQDSVLWDEEDETPGWRR